MTLPPHATAPLTYVRNEIHSKSPRMQYLIWKIKFESVTVKIIATLFMHIVRNLLQYNRCWIGRCERTRMHIKSTSSGPQELNQILG